MAVVSAARFTALKSKVKAEMKRRCRSGSVASYGGTAYDYTTTPAQGGIILKEHRDKLTVPLAAVNSNAVPNTSGEKIISETELSNMEARVTAWSARSITDRSGTDCKSGCTGTCYTGCTTGCYGCGSGCPDGCYGCGSGCPDGCSGCGSGCPDGCSGCGSGCPGSCTGCGSGCPSGCSGCGTGCANGCRGCDSVCNDDCTTACYQDCNNECGDSCLMGMSS